MWLLPIREEINTLNWDISVLQKTWERCVEFSLSRIKFLQILIFLNCKTIIFSITCLFLCLLLISFMERAGTLIVLVIAFPVGFLTAWPMVGSQ